jgi:hypothetical protein
MVRKAISSAIACAISALSSSSIREAFSQSIDCAVSQMVGRSVGVGSDRCGGIRIGAGRRVQSVSRAMAMVMALTFWRCPSTRRVRSSQSATKRPVDAKGGHQRDGVRALLRGEEAVQMGGEGVEWRSRTPDISIFSAKTEGLVGFLAGEGSPVGDALHR